MPESIAASCLGLEPGSELLAFLQRHPDAEALRFRDGEFLIREGDHSRDILVVTRGGFVVERNGPPPTILAQLTAAPDDPGVLGEMAYFGEEPRSASVRSVGSSLTLRLAPHHVDSVLDGFPGLTRVICRQFTLRLREASEALAALRRGLDLTPERKMFQEGEVLFSAGDPAVLLFQLVLGRIRVEAAGAVRSFGPEDLPGGFLDLGPWLRKGLHTCTARAEGSAFLAAVDLSRRPAFLRRYPELVLGALEENFPGWMGGDDPRTP
jgi:CRP-like cAMP-binding protein